MQMIERLREKIVNYVYVVSKQPVLYRDLLRANCMFNEGMHVDPGILNFRKNLTKAYISYGLICASILIPFILITHAIFTKLDFHVSIVGTIIATACVCLGFNVYNVWIRKFITKKLIKKAWEIHFPYFPYEKYNEKVEILYQKALQEEVPRKQFEQYILDNLV